MSETYKTLLLEQKNQIAILTINRPDKLNALNSLVLEELDAVIDRLASDKEVKGVIITGAGEKAFVAGADIKELSNLNGETGEKTSQNGQRILDKLESFPKPVIGVVNGYALGGGTELALACHVRIASDNAVFGLPEVSLGLIPGYGGTQRLTRLVGKGKAMELILTGRMVKSAEAKELGLANSVHPSASEALDAADTMLGNMLKNSPVALEHAIKAVNACEIRKEEGYLTEAKLFGNLCTTKDFKEGTGAFLEKRKPSFTGN